MQSPEKPATPPRSGSLHWPPPYRPERRTTGLVHPAVNHAAPPVQRKPNESPVPLKTNQPAHSGQPPRPEHAAGNASPSRKPRVIQPQLRRYSARADLATVYRSDNNDPAIHTGLDIATTSEPAQYTVPAFNITIERRTPQGFLNRLGWALSAINRGTDTHEVYARLVLTRNADPGTNTSVYLGAGIYETNMHLDEGTYRAQEQNNPGGARNTSNSLSGWSGGKSRVYVVMPAQMAGRNKLAEEEHLRDFIYAYDRTLRVCQHALEAIRGTNFGPHESEEDAREALLEAFLNRVPRPLRRLGMDMNQWGAEYIRLCQKSMSERDGRQWHSFGLERVRRDQLPKQLAITYLTGAPRREGGRVYVRMNTGSTQVGQHAPEQVITYA